MDYRRCWLFCMCLLLGLPAHATLDLARATVEKLDNGLTVIVLEEPGFPLVSVQMLYRSGARDDPAGRSGLAHFVEHMAFRGSENFPDTELVSRIYAAGGEWHGYTYLDQTTYYATAPADQLPLLLRIEADRMAVLRIRAEDIPAECGAVLAEMQGYENDPAAILHDWSVFTSIVAHPYRNNTIGFANDVRAIDDHDVKAFYREHYQPGNAVLAIVGDVDSDAVRRQVQTVFGDLAGRAGNPLPVSVEPSQTGPRRVLLHGATDRQWFQLTWHAPAANDPDWPAFLLLQELIAGSGGINFRQNDWGTPARADRPLADTGDTIATWLMPTAQPYVFAIKGSIAAGASRPDLEHAVAKALRNLPFDEKRLGDARKRLLQEFVMDLQTTEDAAHQLAFFAGLDALDVLLTLKERIAALDMITLRDVAHRYLDTDNVTVAWYLPGESRTPPPAPASENIPSQSATETASATATPTPAPEPRMLRLNAGLPAILQVSRLSPTVHLQVVFNRSDGHPQRVADEPALGVSSWQASAPAEELERLVADAARAAARTPGKPTAQQRSDDPRERLEQLFGSITTDPAPTGTGRVIALALAGDFDGEEAAALLNRYFGDILPGQHRPRASRLRKTEDSEIRIRRVRPQARLGYIVAAPPPDVAAGDAWRALQYLFSHDYAGRLGREAISRRGLVYYIDTRYRSDGDNAWTTVSMGVDPAKLDALTELLGAEMRRLQQEPPTAEDVREAIGFRTGRALSAHQANSELTGEQLRQWLWHGELVSATALRERLAAVSYDDVLDAVDAFTQGTVIRVAVEE